MVSLLAAFAAGNRAARVGSTGAPAVVARGRENNASVAIAAECAAQANSWSRHKSGGVPESRGAGSGAAASHCWTLGIPDFDHEPRVRLGQPGVRRQHRRGPLGGAQCAISGRRPPAGGTGSDVIMSGAVHGAFRDRPPIAAAIARDLEFLGQTSGTTERHGATPSTIQQTARVQ